MTDHSWAGIAQAAQTSRNSLGVRAAAALGIALQIASGSAFAQNYQVRDAVGSTTNLVNGVVPGVATTPYTRPNDSTTGVTQATSNRTWLTECAAGTVLSGGVCVSLPTTPSCSYGQVWTGGACESIGSFTPPSTSCPTGFVLSGGACVALPVPAPSPSCGPMTGVTSQSVACPTGQTGTQIQSRTSTCNASTSYAWVYGGWTTTSNTCVPNPPAAGCSATTLGWSTNCFGSVGATPHNGTATLTDTAGAGQWGGSATGSCSNGSWSVSGGSCTFTSEPPSPPPPSRCGAEIVLSTPNMWFMIQSNRGSSGNPETAQGTGNYACPTTSHGATALCPVTPICAPSQYSSTCKMAINGGYLNATCSDGDFTIQTIHGGTLFPFPGPESFN
jgi:hypothetical protein